MLLMKRDNIILIGMPGAGKSTLGIVMAKKLGMRFVDTDLLIQEGTDSLLSELLAEHGTEGFMRIENDILKGLECEGHIIATGGSAVYGEQAMEHLRNMGTVVFIDIPLDELRSRLHDNLLERGVVARAGTTLDALFEERRPLYERYADITVQTAGMDTLTAIDALCSAVREVR